MKIFSALELQYKRLDESIRKYLTEKLGSSVSGYTSANIFGMILNVIRGVCQNLMLYIEDVAQEHNIDTATRKTSIASLARQAGYEPFYGYAAAGTVTLDLLPNNGVKDSRIIIPDGVRIVHTQTSKSYIGVLPLDYYMIQLGNSFKQISMPVVEGRWYNASWAAQGIPLEAFSVSVTGFYDINYVKVKVNGVLYERYACLYDMPAGAEGYVVTQSFEGTFAIVFGNAVHGSICPTGSSVRCSFISHSGAAGNLSVTDSDEFVFGSPLQDSNGDNIDGNDIFIIRREHLITGGVNAESVESIRSMLGYNSRSLVLANTDNFKLFLSRFSFIGYSNVWSEQNDMTTNIAALTNAAHNLATSTDYFSLHADDLVLSDEQKNMITTTIYNSQMTYAGSQIEFVDPIIRNYAMFVYLKVNEEYDTASVAEAVKTSIAEYFIGITGDTTFISKSVIAAEILNNVDGVVSVEITMVSQTNEDGYRTGSYNIYKQQWINGVYRNQVIECAWTKDSEVGLDRWNNIQLDSKMEFPVLLGGFRYYPDKNVPWQSVMTDAVNIYFI